MGTKKFYAVAVRKGCADSYPPEKVARQAAADMKRTVHSLGLLISGCRVHDNDDVVFERDEGFGKKATDMEAREVVRTFVRHGAGQAAKQVAAEFLKQLRGLLTWFEKDHSHAFYNCSLLFVYDAGEPSKTDRVKVRLIDFCHSWRMEPGEEDISGVDHGVRTLIDVLAALEKAPKLKKPVWKKVHDVKPDSRGLNLKLKVINVERDDAAKVNTWEVIAGDGTGVLKLRLFDEDHATACQKDASIRVQNALVLMKNGYIRVVINKWGVLKVADSPFDFDVKVDKDISATEYELQG